MIDTIVTISIIVTGIASLIWLADREKPFMQAAARRFTDDNAAIRVQAHNRWAQRASIGTRDAPRLSRLRIHVRNQAVRGSKIDTDNTTHGANAIPSER